MEKSLPTSVRLSPLTKGALERAAKDDDRSVSSLVERVLKAWLTEHGHLKTPSTDRT